MDPPWRGLGVEHLDFPEAVIVEGAGVYQLIGRLQPAAARVLVNESLIRECLLRVFV